MRHHNFTALAAAAAIAALAACSKTPAQEPAETLQPVKFSIETLAAEYGPLTKATGSDKINTLAHKAIKPSAPGHQYAVNAYTTEQLAALDLSALEVKLPAGDFTMYFVAGGKDTTDPLTWSSTEITMTDPRELFAGSVTGVNIQTAQEYSVTLERVTGALALNITDLASAPANFTKVKLACDRPNIWNPVAGTFTGSNSASVELTKEEITAGEYKSVLPFSARTIQVQVYNGGTIVTTYSVSAAVYSNRKTIITGALFGGTGSFSVSVEDTWGDDNPVNIQ